MKERITKRAVDATEAKDGKPVFLWDSDLSGFGLKVSPTGRKVYILQYRTREQTREDAPRRITIGKHGEFTPDKARVQAAKLLRDVKAGDDPRETWKRGEAHTVEELSKRFLKEYLPAKKRPPRASTISFYEGLFRCHILPRLGKKRVDEITTADVERLHAAMRETPYVANRTLSLIQYAFDQAERWEWRPQGTNPAVHIDRYPEEKRGEKREVMLNPKQMATLLAAIDEEEKKRPKRAGAKKKRRTDPFSCGAIRMVFWTGWRIGEVLRLRWENVDLERGVAKLLRTKTAREEYRQIPVEALELLEGLPRLAGSPWVFPGRDPKKHLTTVRRPWARIRKRAGLHELDGLGALRLHDLRHNVVSWDVSRGVPLEIAGKNVGHRSRRSTETYAHFAPDALKQAVDARANAMREAVEAAEEA